MKKPVQISLLSGFLLTLVLLNIKGMTKLQKEIWKDVIGFEGLYKVSSLGRIKSISRNGTSSFDKILSHQFSKGYPSVKLSKNNISKRYTVHRQVALVFLKTPNFKLLFR